MRHNRRVSLNGVGGAPYRYGLLYTPISTVHVGAYTGTVLCDHSIGAPPTGTGILVLV